MTSIIDFGADPTGQMSSVQACKDAFSSGARVVDVPPGTYRIDQDLRPSVGVRLRGAGGAFRGAASTLHLVGDATVRIDNLGRSCALEDMAIKGDRYAPRDALVVATAAFNMRGCYLLNSGKHGIRIDGANGVGNANGWKLDDVTIENCGEASPGQYGSDGYGVLVSGQDSQGSGRGVRVVSSWGGIGDRSFLGSTWTDCHAEGCAGRGYLSDTARSVWVGCYCELDSPTQMGSCIVLGGTLAAVVRQQAGPPAQRSAPLVVDAGEISRLLVRSTAGASGVRSFVGFSDGRTPLAWQANEDAHEVGLTAHGGPGPNGGPGSQVWAICRARSLSLASLLVTRIGHALGADQLIAPKGIHLPDGPAWVKVDAATIKSIEARLAALESAP